MKRINITRVAVAAVAGALAASAAHAAEKSKIAAQPAVVEKTAANGMLVRFVNATPEQVSQAAKSGTTKSAAGMRAYVDSTGRLHAGTPEEAAALSPAPQARVAARSAARSSAVQSSPALTAGPNGSFSLQLDESSMVYAVAKRQPDGKVAQECVTGEETAKTAAVAPATRIGEDRHEK